MKRSTEREYERIARELAERRAAAKAIGAPKTTADEDAAALGTSVRTLQRAEAWYCRHGSPVPPAVVDHAAVTVRHLDRRAEALTAHAERLATADHPGAANELAPTDTDAVEELQRAAAAQESARLIVEQSGAAVTLSGSVTFGGVETGIVAHGSIDATGYYTEDAQGVIVPEPIDTALCGTVRGGGAPEGALPHQAAAYQPRLSAQHITRRRRRPTGQR